MQCNKEKDPVPKQTNSSRTSASVSLALRQLYQISNAAMLRKFRHISACLLCFAVEIKAKTKGFEAKEGKSELVDLPKKEDVALFLHTSGTTSRPKVHVMQSCNTDCRLSTTPDSFGRPILFQVRHIGTHCSCTCLASLLPTHKHHRALQQQKLPPESQGQNMYTLPASVT